MEIDRMRLDEIDLKHEMKKLQVYVEYGVLRKWINTTLSRSWRGWRDETRHTKHTIRAGKHRNFERMMSEIAKSSER